MAYMIWNYNGLLITYFFANKSFNLMVFFLNQIQLTLEFLKEVFLGLSFFSSSSNDVHSSFRHCKIITYADDTEIFTSSSDIDVIQSNLSKDLDNLSNSFRDNELIFNLKKGKSEVMLFGTGKRLNLFGGCQVKLSVNDDPINTTTCYKYLGVHLDPTLHFETHFQKSVQEGSRKSEPLTAHPFQH